MEFVEEPFEVSIRDGIAILKWPDGNKRGVPLRVFRIQTARCIKVLADYDAKRAVVLPLKRKRGE